VPATVVDRLEVVDVQEDDHELAVVEAPGAADLAYQSGKTGGPAKRTRHLVHGRGLVKLLQAASDRLDQVLVQAVEPGRRDPELARDVHHQLMIDGGGRAQLGHAPAPG